MSKKPKAPEKENSERWLVTYADLMNLLLILFIILFASSQLDKNKAEKVAKGVREGFGYIENGGTGAGDGSGTGLYGNSWVGVSPSESAGPDTPHYYHPDSVEDSQEKAFQKLYGEVVQLVQKSNLQNMVDVTLNTTGVVISFKDNALFPSGSAELNGESVKLIDNIGNLLKGIDYSYILVEGHTDTDPIHTAQYKDNMDLSTQRAANVWRELVNMGIQPSKMASIGYGEYKPVVSNDSHENKARNRRVVVTIMNSQGASSSDIITNASGASATVTAHPSPQVPAVAGSSAAVKISPIPPSVTVQPSPKTAVSASAAGH